MYMYIYISEVKVHGTYIIYTRDGTSYPLAHINTRTNIHLSL